jgi:hypothetical protein
LLGDALVAFAEECAAVNFDAVDAHNALFEAGRSRREHDRDVVAATNLDDRVAERAAI